ncbi:MAG: 1-deoxy-D-xylulose-5-phosphate synthase [Actinomycetes bacterium]|jgi:1-deoxy-D-xylulose-5-phosphate synthase|nr:1-deoxy-D-xylulose-5-phosphate synthase [Actinomycetes bacterium]
MKLLDRIQSPRDLKDLDGAQLAQLANEIRARILQVTAVNGGHVAPNLGIVELTIGAYRALDMPPDVVTYDVGHQSYVHKLLTGRAAAFDSLRTYGGISGFPKRSESPYDLFGTGHASDSLSVALGYALARNGDADGGRVLAIVGDGSLTGGMAWEALNHIGHQGCRLTILLNDNEMSISPNVGALTGYLGRIRLDKRYWGKREFVQKELATRGGRLGRAMLTAGTRVKDSFKHLLVPGVVFEELGISYVGPIDGHDIGQVERAVKSAAAAPGPVIIHAVTRKGRGYVPAEDNPTVFHGVGPFDVATGQVKSSAGSPPKYTQVFSDALIREAELNPGIVAITAAMASGTGLDAFRDYVTARGEPQRFIDVGIAEEHAVGLAAGLALEGRKIPVCAIYSTFLQRAYDQIISDVALQGAHVVFALDRAGFVGDDGPTHHGLYDLSYLRTIPTMQIMAPSDEAELVGALHTAIELDGPVALRYPRGSGTGVAIPDRAESWEVGRVRVLRAPDKDAAGDGVPAGEHSADGAAEDTQPDAPTDARTCAPTVALLAVGRMVAAATQVAKRLDADGIAVHLADMRWVKPLDGGYLTRVARESDLVVTIEENSVRGGFGTGVMEYLADAELTVPILQLGTPDAFTTQGTMEQLLHDAGLDADGIYDSVCARLQRVTGNGKQGI